MPRRIEKSTPERTARWKKSLDETLEERNELRAEGKKLLNAARIECAEFSAIFQALRAKRETLGLSLRDVSERTGMTRESISRLENLAGVNATFATVERYAQALGLHVHCVLQEVR